MLNWQFNDGTKLNHLFPRKKVLNLITFVQTIKQVEWRPHKKELN